MNSAGAFDAKEQVRRAVDIVDVVGGYLPLRRQGRLYVATCPWHDDSRPSLQVNPLRQSWKCWVCAIGGDVFSFVMRREGVEFPEALRMLAEKAGIQLPKFQGAPVTPGGPDDKTALYAAMAWVERQYHECLLRSQGAQVARTYLSERGITDESIARFHIGYAPPDWQWLIDRAKSTPHTPSILEAIGVCRKNERGRYWDFFRGRVIFPIRDVRNRPIALGGRILPGQADADAAKYFNCSETKIYSKSEQLYGLNLVRDVLERSRENRHVLVMEGYTDVVIAHQAGLDNAVAVCGTALGARHVQLLKRFADSVTLVLDGDEAGRNRTNEILELFVGQPIDLRVLTLPNELDPADFLLERGSEPFREMLKGSLDALEHKIQTATAGIDLLRDTHKSNQALEEILGAISKAPQSSTGDDAALRLREQQMITRLGRQFQLSEGVLRERLTALRKAAAAPAANASAPAAIQSKPVAISSIDPWELELLEVLVEQPEASAVIVEAIGPEEVMHSAARSIYEVVCRLVHDGRESDFQSVLQELTDPHLAGFLVEIDERSQERQAAVRGLSNLEGASPELRVKDLVAKFQRRSAERHDRQRLEAIKSHAPLPEGASPEELALELLREEQRRRRQEIESQRLSRQGLQGPKEG